MFPGVEALGGGQSFVILEESLVRVPPDNIQTLFFIGIGVIFPNEIFQSCCPSIASPEQSGVLAGCKLLLQMQNKHQENMKTGAFPLHLGKGA